MIELNNLENASHKKDKIQRVGRGPGSGRGKTSCRGQKGAGARSGHKRRYGYEGGQMRLFAKLPHRGFSRGRFLKDHFILNLVDIERIFSDGEMVSLSSLLERKMLPKDFSGKVKILSTGEITKKVTIEANSFSKQAQAKLDNQKISYKVV
jgi:large subunit ribosomal protein L15